MAPCVFGGLNLVVVFGSDKLKRAFLPRAAAGVTEQDAGTDTSRVATRARLNPTDVAANANDLVRAFVSDVCHAAFGSEDAP